MGAFICQISERDWPKAVKLGVYGNRLNKPNSTEPLRNQDRLSVIRDLIGISEGDSVFFHVIRNKGESTIHGVYKARSRTFFDETKIWDDDYELFPHRFLFEPHDEFIELCSNDSYIKVSEFYAKIEQRKIWSQATLENERNIERRAVRKISSDDADVIVKLLVRDFSKKQENTIFNLIKKSKTATDLKAKVNSIGAIENAIKAVIMSELRDQTDFIKDVFGNIIDFMNEVFIAPTTRKLVDILVISQIETERCYFIVEAKTDLFRINDLTQVLSYMDLFTQKDIFKLNLDKIAGCTISKRIESAAMEFVSLLNELDIFGKIHVINYVPRNKGQDTEFLYKIPPVQFIETAPQLPHLPAHLSYDDITERKILNIPFCELPQNVNLKVREKNEEGKQYLLEKIMGKDSTHIDYMYLEFLRGVLEWKQFINFMLNYKNLVERIGSKDYMEVIPIICAPEIDPKVSRFVELYNEYYKRKPIKLFLF